MRLGALVTDAHDRTRGEVWPTAHVI